MSKDPAVVVVGYRSVVRDPATVMDMVVPETLQSGKPSAKTIKFQEELAFLKPTGKIVEIAALCMTGDQKTFASSAPDVAVQFCQWLLSFASFADLPHGGYAPSTLFFGFNLKPLMRLLGMDMLRAGQRAPLGLWYGNDACYDPYEMLTETESRGLVTVQKLCAEAPGAKIECPIDYQQHANAEADARLALTLCLQYGLLPAYATSAVTGTLDATTPKPDDLPDEAQDSLEDEDTDDADDDDEGAAAAPKTPRRRTAKAR